MKEVGIYKILPVYCNEKGIVTIKNLTGLMLDLAFKQSERLEKNLSIMDGKVWLIYAWDIEFISPIYEGNKIEITTFPTYMKRFYAYRNFEIRGNGEIVVRAKASMVLFDRKKGRASIIDEKIAAAYGENEETYSGNPYKLAKDFEKEKEIQVRRADFDQNHHVNNGIYFDYLKEIQGFDEEKVSFIKLVYKNEIRKEDEVLIFYKKNESDIDFKIESDKNHAYGVFSYV